MVRQAEATLLAMREALQDSLETLQHKCQRALAYARVYAEDSPDLLSKLETVELQRPRGPRSVAALPAEVRLALMPRAGATSTGTGENDPLFLNPRGGEAAASQAA